MKIAKHPQQALLMDLPPRSCGLCNFARFDSNHIAAEGACTNTPKGATPGTNRRPFVIRQDFGTCCERFVADDCIKPMERRFA